MKYSSDLYREYGSLILFFFVEEIQKHVWEYFGLPFLLTCILSGWNVLSHMIPENLVEIAPFLLTVHVALKKSEISLNSFLLEFNVSFKPESLKTAFFTAYFFWWGGIWFLDNQNLFGRWFFVKDLSLQSRSFLLCSTTVFSSCSTHSFIYFFPFTKLDHLYV